MPPKPPRHPDDVAAERHLAGQLLARRQSAGLTQPQVAQAAGVEYRSIGAIERGNVRTSRCDLYAGYARAVDHELIWVANGLPEMDSPHANNLTAMATAADTWAQHDALHLAAFIAQLVAVREHLGWTVTELARRRGVTPWSVEQFEDGRSATALLATLQAHVRALGGVLLPQFAPAELEVAA